MKPWDLFFKDKITKIFSEKKEIIDIGGGLRVSKKSGNRFDPKRSWILPLLQKVSYKIMDPISDFNPDIVGDIHHLPFADSSVDAFICIAVMEHIEDPMKASQEMYRTLKTGGYAFIYVPFLYYYHAEKGYYKDYWRFTEDSLQLMFKSFSLMEVQGVRGAFETWLHLSPLGRISILKNVFRLLDKISGKDKSRQISGYNVFLIK